MPTLDECVEYLCRVKFPEYQYIKNQRRLDHAITPTNGTYSQSSEVWARYRHQIDPGPVASESQWAKNKRVLESAERYKTELRMMGRQALLTLYEQRRAEQHDKQINEAFARAEERRRQYRPDWDFWSYLLDVELWQACALSLNIDPEKLKRCEEGVDPQSFPNAEAAEYFRKRLLLAESHPLALYTSMAGEVQLARFVHWAKTMPLFSNLPAELIALAKNDGNPVTKEYRSEELEPSPQKRELRLPRTLTGTRSVPPPMSQSLTVEAIVQKEEDSASAPVGHHADDVGSGDGGGEREQASPLPDIRIGWHKVLIASWPSMLKKYGKRPTAHEIMRYLKNQARENEGKGPDSETCILARGHGHKLFWKTDDGEEKEIEKKTVENKVSELIKRGYLSK